MSFMKNLKKISRVLTTQHCTTKYSQNYGLLSITICIHGWFSVFQFEIQFRNGPGSVLLLFISFQIMIASLIRSGAAADRRTPLKSGAQLDLASPYAVPRTRRTESPTSLNYAKLCIELNYTGAAIGGMWGDLVIRHIVLE